MKKSKRIQVLMVKKSISQRSIAKKIGVCPQFLNQVVMGVRQTRWVREEIAKALALPFERVWGKGSTHVGESATR